MSELTDKTLIASLQQILQELRGAEHYRTDVRAREIVREGLALIDKVQMQDRNGHNGPLPQALESWREMRVSKHRIQLQFSSVSAQVLWMDFERAMGRLCMEEVERELSVPALPEPVAGADRVPDVLEAEAGDY